MEQAGMMQDNLKSCFPSSSTLAPLSTFTSRYIHRPPSLQAPPQAPNSYFFLDNTLTFTVPCILLCTCLLLPPSKAEVVAGLGTGVLILYYLSSYMFGGLISWASGWAWNGEGDTDVMVTVDALKTTNKELKKQYGKIDLDKSTFSLLLDSFPNTVVPVLVVRSFLFTDMQGWGVVEQLQDEMADLMDVCFTSYTA